jgi:kumamolisin
VINGKMVVMGGTSASTPLWAGLIARLNQALGRNIGYFNPLLYQKIGPLGGLRDITQGNNSTKGIKGYSARPGWDPCTGWGSPNGAKLLDALRTQMTSPQKPQGRASSKPN